MPMDSELNRMVENAKQVLCNTFIFDNPWDMEQCRKRYTFKQDIDWNFHPWDDPEWNFMLSRFAFLDNLKAAWMLTGEIKYLSKGKALLHDFHVRNPRDSQNIKTSWRTLDASIRMHHALSFPCGDEQWFRQFINAHALYIHEVDSVFLSISNWGSIGYAYLFEAALYLQDEAMAFDALQRLQYNLERSILPDGVQFEQSPMYHAEVLFSLLTAIKAGKAARFDVPAFLVKTARNMLLASLKGMKPNNFQFMQSDSDDTDLRSLFSFGALVLHDGLFKSFGYPSLSIPYDRKDIETYARILPVSPDFKSSCLFFSGNIYLRSGWEHTSLVTHFKTGHVGSGHGHSDLLHIDIAKGNTDILTDCGRYTYIDSKLRYNLKGASSHNTIIIDQQDFSTIQDTWEYSRIPEHGCPIFNEGNHYLYASGFNYSYEGVVVRREIIQIKTYGVCIFDTLLSSSQHEIQRSFHFGIGEEPKDVHGAITTNHSILWYDEKESTQIESVHISKHYNTLDTTKTVRLISIGARSTLSAIFAFDTTATLEKEPVFIKETGQIIDGRSYTLSSSGKELFRIIHTPLPTRAKAGLVGDSKFAGYGRILLYCDEQYETILV